MTPEQLLLKQKTREAYNLNAAFYAEYADGDIRENLFRFHFGRFCENDRMTWVLLAGVIRKLRAHQKGNLFILDVGCGQGTWLLRLADYCPKVLGFGIDITPRLVDLAVQNSKTRGLQDRVMFEVSDGTALGFKDKSFDFVVCLHDVLNNEVEYEKIISELHRISRRCVVVSVHSIQGNRTCYVDHLRNCTDIKQSGDIISFLDRNGIKQEVFSHLFSAEEIKKVIKEYGGSVVDAFGVDLLHSRFAMTGSTQFPLDLRLLERKKRRHPDTINYYQHIVVVSKPN